MSIRFSSITVTTFQLPKMLSFYEILGVQFDLTKVDKGSQLYRAKMNDIEFVLCEAVGGSYTEIPRLQLSFSVSNCEQTSVKLVSAGFYCILDPADLQGRKTSIFNDPDGNTVEIFSL